MDYPSHKRNLSTFVASLPRTRIKFIYSNKKEVQVETEFHLYKLNGRVYYIINSEKQGGVYVFKESKLTYLLGVFSTTRRDPIILSDIKFQDSILKKNIKEGKRYDVNHGDHMTFTLAGIRSPPSTVVKAHFTYYNYFIDEFTFPRYTEECNFTLPSSLKDFNKIHCENNNGTIIRQKTIENEFQSIHKRAIVKDLCIQIQKSDHVPLIMRGGYRQNYKSVHFMAEQFYDFVFETLLDKLYPYYDFTMFYDESNKISSDHIVLLASDNEDSISVLYIDPGRCFKACFAHHNREIATKRELVYLEKWQACASAIIKKTMDSTVYK